MTELIKATKHFDFIKEDGTALVVCASQMTVRQLQKLAESIAERIKDGRRKEAVETAKYMQGKDKLDFLVEAAKRNTASDEEIKDYYKSTDGIKMVLNQFCEPVIPEEIMFGDLNKDALIGAYLFCLGADEQKPSTKEGEGSKGEGDFFPANQHPMTD